MKISQYKTTLLLLFFSLTIVGCKKFIEVDPPATNVNQGNVYQNDGTATSAVIGIYSSISLNSLPGIFSYFPELSADNMTLLNANQIRDVGYYQNNLLAVDDGSGDKPWSIIYPQIFSCNALIEGLNENNAVTPSIRQNLLGQVYFLRAFFYFYLTNFYGDVPLALSTDYTVNNSLKRASVTDVYSQIISDLKQAQNLLPEGYLTGDMKAMFSSGQEQRVSANRFAATALLARVYLYNKDYPNAEAMATEVINRSSTYSASVPLNEIFLKNSKETIWALQPVTVYTNASEAEFYTLRDGEPDATTARSAYLKQGFLDIFQTGDQRKVAWIGTITTGNQSYAYPAKYKALTNSEFTEQSILLRVAEQYLIRAEARIQLNKVADGISDLNILRERAIDKTEPDQNKRLKLLATTLNKEEALAALSYERRVELFAESAHRWFDLKRSGQMDAVMGPATANKGGTWASYKALYPLPAADIIYNPALVQNTGYNN